MNPGLLRKIISFSILCVPRWIDMSDFTTLRSQQPTLLVGSISEALIYVISFHLSISYRNFNCTISVPFLRGCCKSQDHRSCCRFSWGESSFHCWLYQRWGSEIFPLSSLGLHVSRRLIFLWIGKYLTGCPTYWLESLSLALHRTPGNKTYLLLRTYKPSGRKMSGLSMVVEIFKPDTR